MWCSAASLGYRNRRLNEAFKRQLCRPPQLACQCLHAEKIEVAARIFAEGMKGDLDARGRKYGLVLDIGGYYRNLFTLSPALTIRREEMDLALELLDQLFRRCRAR